MPEKVEEKLLLDISLTALKQAKISWQNMPAPRVPKSMPPSKPPSSRPPHRPPSTRMRAAKPS
jgi:hypothetical protein